MLFLVVSFNDKEGMQKMNNLNVFKKVRIGIILLVMLLISSTAWAEPPVKYLDENGETKTITNYIELVGDESPDDPMFKNGGWFVVKGEVTYDEVQGNYLPFELQIDEDWNRLGPDVNLILADGAKLTAKNENSEMSFRNLAVYAQSTGENMGKFEVYAENSTAISVFNAFTVYGGSVKAVSENSDGISAGSVTVHGGIVDAAGITYGIYADDAKVIINGGSVTAAGFRGILGSEGIEINGGDVDATATGVSDEYNFSYAIGSWYDVNVNGGSLTVHAKDKSSYGVYVSGSVAHLNAGEVFADGEGSGIAARPSCSSSGVELAGATVTTNRYTYIDDLGPKNGFFVKVAVNVLYTDGEGNVFEGSIFKWDDLVGEFIDELDVVAGKTLRPFKPNIVVTQDGEGKIHAKINGNYIGEDDFIITDRIEVDDVKFERDFTTEGYSTIVLPFNIKTSLLVGVDSVLSFNGIVLDENKKKAVAMQVVWEKSMEEVELQAYTPYLFRMSDKSLEILGSVVLETTRDAVTEKDGWEFRGTYSFMKWTEDSPDLGRVYGFAASSEGDVSVGQFVKIAAGASIRPLRAYLVCMEQPSMARANGYYANRNVVSIKDELPEQMNLVIVGKDKNGEEHTTVIGQFNTRSGEFRANSVKRVYDLKGRPVNKAVRKIRGAYYGKKLLH